MLASYGKASETQPLRRLQRRTALASARQRCHTQFQVYDSKWKNFINKNNPIL
jgi:hypothetical protein